MVEIPKRYFRRFFVLGGFIFVASLLWGAFWVQNHAKLKKAEIEIAGKFKEFKAYKDKFYLPAIEVLGPKGNFVSLKDYGGRYTVLNIWATWCAPCVKELPALHRLSKAIPYDMGWRVIAVSVDPKKNLPAIAKFAARYDIEDMAAYHDYNLELQNAVDVSRLPMTLIVNKYGRVLYEIHGSAFWHDRDIIDFLDLVRKVY